MATATDRVHAVGFFLVTAGLSIVLFVVADFLQ